MHWSQRQAQWVNYTCVAGDVKLYYMKCHHWVDFGPPAWTKASSGTYLEDISHDMALPCSGHIDVAIPVLSVQAGVTVFSGRKNPAASLCASLCHFSQGHSGRFPFSVRCPRVAPWGASSCRWGLSLPIVAALIQNEGEGLSSFSNTHNLLLNETSSEQGQ